MASVTPIHSCRVHGTPLTPFIDVLTGRTYWVCWICQPTTRSM